MVRLLVRLCTVRAQENDVQERGRSLMLFGCCSTRKTPACTRSQNEYEVMHS